MKILVVQTVNPTSISEQVRLLAEKIGATAGGAINPTVMYDLVVFVGPPNSAFEQLNHLIRTRRKVCYWIVEGILTSVGRKRARTASCDLSITVSPAVKRWMEESDVYIDYVIPHEIIIPTTTSTGEKGAVYIAGNYARKWPPWAIMTLISSGIDAYYKPEIPDQFAGGFNAHLERYGVKRLEKTSKSELYEFMARYSVYANLSASEGYGLFPREALSMSMNVVAVDHDAFQDIMMHPCFYAVPHKDVLYIKSTRDDVLEEFMTWDPGEYVETLKKALENRCKEPLRIEPHYNKMKMLINQLLNK